MQKRQHGPPELLFVEFVGTAIGRIIGINKDPKQIEPKLVDNARSADLAVGSSTGTLTFPAGLAIPRK